LTFEKKRDIMWPELEIANMGIASLQSSLGGTAAKGIQITKLQNMHMEIIRLAVAGMRQCDIAEELGITPVCVNYTLKSPIAQLRIAELRAARDREAVDFSARLKNGAGRAIDLLDSVMDGELSEQASLGLRTKAATEILDRAGYAKVTKSINMNLDGKLTENDIQDLTNNALEIAKSRGMVAEVLEGQVSDSPPQISVSPADSDADPRRDYVDQTDKHQSCPSSFPFEASE
jgi:predicted transcriptional regulator